MYAGFWSRLRAFAIDYVLIFTYMGVVFLFSVFIMPSVQEWFQGSRITAQLSGFMLITLPVSLYFIVADSKIGKQSFGKRQMHIKVVNDNNQLLSIGQATVRTLIKFLPWELSHYMAYRMIYLGDADLHQLDYWIGGMIYVLIFLYVFMVVFTKNKQSFYDRLLKTYVVNTRFS
ncbi:RDD family protein [Planococcus versutus]|uniref:RDD domain-containing protein n=1 Tax=Planococcus versutus TaxID=1302659 RepID=A0A1B1RXS7_9BACL|nr:RDD family protein [Planococcus versutus]ANU25740.1 hypothetical protein I858_001435 [Planococcus versutus]